MLKRPSQANRRGGVLLQDLYEHFCQRWLVHLAMERAGVKKPPLDRRLHRSARRPLTMVQAEKVMRWCYVILGQKAERHGAEYFHYLSQLGLGSAGEKPQRFYRPRRKRPPDPEETERQDSPEDEPE